MFSSNVEDNNIFPCLHTIILSYYIYNCLSDSPIKIRMSTSNSKHGSFLYKKKPNLTTYPKGKALMQMYRVVPQTKRANYLVTRSILKSKQYSTSAIHFLPNQCFRWIRFVVNYEYIRYGAMTCHTRLLYRWYLSLLSVYKRSCLPCFAISLLSKLKVGKS